MHPRQVGSYITNVLLQGQEQLVASTKPHMITSDSLNKNLPFVFLPYYSLQCELPLENSGLNMIHFLTITKKSVFFSILISNNKIFIDCKVSVSQGRSNSFLDKQTKGEVKIVLHQKLRITMINIILFNIYGAFGKQQQDFPGGSAGKASAYNEGDPGSVLRSGRSPGEGNGNPFQYSYLEKSHGRRSLPLDFETKKAYTFKVEASNVHLDHRFHSAGPFKDTATVKISVLDVDEPPVFSRPLYTMEVYEDTPVGTIIGAVTAQDLDVGSSAIIQIVSAADRDLSPAGQQFSFKLSPEAAIKPNFTVRDFRNNTAGIETRRNGYSRRQQELYFLPVVIEDSSYPVQSSTNTMTIRVCRCDSDGTILSCNVEAIFLPVGLSTGALIAILLCIVILLAIVVLYVALRRQKKKDTLMTSKEDIRDNVIHYDDEGGGEEDTQAFDIGALRNPKVIEDNKIRRDIKPDSLCLPRQRPPVEDNTDIRDFIHQRLQEHDVDPTAPPYDSLATYAYEGSGSAADSLSSIESLTTEAEQDFNYLADWGPRFKVLADMFGEEESYTPDKVT
ncbi:hypothetical protein FD755_018549 [Muntiacus reevesi]|uniref:Cadherin domain-containing protein n=1 Tax=Muntiacus reevesi TaxID=9886 RepID=A0A5N3X8T2_MUNRE|nr:hypothetical protein FD755_018549 [Muntiacus reevesi]